MLVQVYTCQNATLLEISCTGSIFIFFFLFQATNEHERKAADPFPLEAKRQRGQQQQQHHTTLLRLCQLTVALLFMRRLHLRHCMRQRRRRITQLKRGQLHKICLRDIILRCRIIIQLHKRCNTPCGIL